MKQSHPAELKAEQAKIQLAYALTAQEAKALQSTDKPKNIRSRDSSSTGEGRMPASKRQRLDNSLICRRQ